MKLQDIVFLLIFVWLFYKKRPEWFVATGILFLIVAIPLYSFWIFFTAERFVIYAAFSFLCSIIIALFSRKKRK